MSGWDGFFNDMDMAIQRDNHNLSINGYKSAIVKYEARLLRLNNFTREVMSELAGVYGIHSACWKQLKRYDPLHPLVEDDALVAKIFKGSSAIYDAIEDGTKEKDYIVCKRYGQNYPIPGYSGPVVPVVTVAPVKLAAPDAVKTETSVGDVYNHPAYINLQEQYAASLALRSSLSEVVRQFDKNHPLVVDSKLQFAIRNAGRIAFTIGNRNYEAAREAGFSFVLPKKDQKDTNGHQP